MKDFFEAIVAIVALILYLAFIALMFALVVAIPVGLIGGIAFAVGYCAHLGWSFF